MAGVKGRKADFPIFELPMNGRPLVYLDTGASAQKPHAVIDAMAAVMKTHYANIHRGLYAFSQETTTAYESARGKIARFINAFGEREIVFTRNATESVNLVAQTLGRKILGPGDEILITEMEHHANIVPWQLICGMTGAVVRVARVHDDGTLDMDSLIRQVSAKTKIMGLVHVSNALGTINPVAEIIRTVKAINPETVVLVDGAQSAVHGPVDVQELGCDFFVFTGHKLYGPTGVGVLWGRYDLLNALPPYQGGGDMIEHVSFVKTTFKEPPARFEAGTPAIVEVIGLGAAVDYLSGIGMKNVAVHEKGLFDRAMKALAAVPGLTFYGTGPMKAGILSFTADWGHPSDIGMILDQCGIAVRTGHHCCMPLMQRFGIDATVRASFGVYSDESDIEALAEGLKKAKSLLA